MNIVSWLFASLLFTYYTWGLYLACMALIRVKDTLPPQTKIMAYPIVAVGLIFDFILNAVIGSVLFWELPQYQKKEWLFTGRVSRWNDDSGKRGDFARWVCRFMLDPFDLDGHHCH